MSLEPHKNDYQALNEWFKTPLGTAVAKQFRNVIEPFGENLKGEVLVQFGSGGENNWLELFNYQNRYIISPFSIPVENEVQSLLNQTPIARDSVDCVVVPLTLEPLGTNLSLLDEIDRILKPMGFAVFCCFNPWSFWGASLKTNFLQCYASRKVKLFTPFSLNRILLQRGYRQCALTHFCYIPPINNQSAIEKFLFLNEVGKMLWPFPSGLYCCIAQKFDVIEPNYLVKNIIDAPEAAYKNPLLPAMNKWY